MKKLLFSILIVGTATVANAQKSEVAEAKKKWGIFSITGGKGAFDKTMASLNDGLAHTDKAIANEKSNILPEAWSYRALFASTIYATDSVNVENAEAKRKIAEEAITKAKSLDTKGDEKDNITTAETNILNGLKTKAYQAYTKKDYEKAYSYYDAVTKVQPDTTFYLYTGVSAQLANKLPAAIENFKQVIKLNGSESKGLYNEIINIYLKTLKDTTSALATIKEALVKYPNNGDLIAAETDIYITRGNIEESRASLTKLIASNPKNALYQYLMGNTYFNTALNVQKERDKLDQKKVKEYNAETAKVVALIDQSIPFYKTALELDPVHAPTLDILTKIYAFKGDTKSYDEIKKRLDAIPAKN
ncbi:MAG: tetratricopeptide repeat protein [Pedobacter sp.]|nr:MAG: tetratricopeptide repeat protein [Pedobacter sp.]